MNQLIERVLAVCSRLTPVDWAALVRYWESLQRDLLAVALHSQLLEIRGEPLQVLFIRQDCNRLCIEAVVIPDGEQSHQYRQVARERRGTKMLIHLVETIQHGAEVIRTNRNHRRKANRRIHRVATANPIPELEHVGGVDTEL